MALARLTDPKTSHQAAASVKDITKTQAAILALLTKAERTDESLIRAYHFRAATGRAPRASESGIRSRRAELVRAGKVIDTGRTEKLSSGRRAIVWTAA